MLLAAEPELEGVSLNVTGRRLGVTSPYDGLVAMDSQMCPPPAMLDAEAEESTCEACPAELSQAPEASLPEGM